MFKSYPATGARSRARALRLALLTSGALLAATGAFAQEAQVQAEAGVASDAAAAALQDANTGAATEAAAAAVDELVVTARNKKESLQDVPIPITAVGGDQLARERITTIADLTQRAPGLTATTPNARRTGVSLRGIGKTSGNDNMEAAVGVIVDDVFLGHVGMTYQDFTDLSQVEIIRGPQGTLLGKNASLGVIKYSSKAPSFDPEGLIELEGGISRSAFKARASYSDGLIDNTLAYRASAFLDEQEGDLLNIGPTGGHYHERNRFGGRIQFLYTPTENLSFKLNLDGAKSDENSNTKPFMVDPVRLNDNSLRTITYSTRLARDYFGGYTPIIGSWDVIDMDMAEPLETENSGASLVANWDAGNVQLTSITAVRSFGFNAKNDQEQTRFAISRSGTLVETEQLSQEFRISGALSDVLDYQAGLYFFKIETGSTGRSTYGKDAGAFFASNAQYATLNTVGGRPFLQSSLQDIISRNYQNPISESQAVFGQTNWKISDKATLTLGARYTLEQKTNTISKTSSKTDGSAITPTGNATADAIRASQLGTDYATIQGVPIDDSSVAWLINPNYKVNDDLTVYASVSYGGKSGAVAFENNGTPRNVLPEKTTDYELGFKSQWFDKALTVNVNAYYTEVEDYQNVTSEPDPTSASGFSSRLGNIPGIRAQGVEFDAFIDVSDSLTITLGGAYNDAIYTDWSTATCPRSFPTSVPICNNTGKQIVGAPRVNLVAGFNFEHEWPGSEFRVHAFGNTSFRSKHNLEQLLSPYGFQDKYAITDLGIGLIRDFDGREVELSVVGKNIFDKHYTTSVNDFSPSAPVGFDGIGPRRYVGALLRAKF